MRSTLPLRGERFRCGCPKSLENTTYRRKHRDEPFRPCCKACSRASNVVCQARRQAKRTPKPVQWISAPREVIESCRPRYLREIEPKQPTGRPRKQSNIPTSEAA